MSANRLAKTYNPEYKVYILIENDNMRVLFDKHDLIHEVLNLYRKMHASPSCNITQYTLNLEEYNAVKDLLANKTFPYNERKVDLVDNLIGCALNLNHMTKQLGIDESKTESVIVPPREGRYKSLASSVDNPLLKVIDTKPMIEFPSKYDNFHNATFELRDKQEVIENPSGIEKSDLSGYQFADIWEDVKKDLEKKTPQNSSSLSVVYNNLYECVLPVAHSERITQICEEFRDFELIRTFSNLDSKTYSAIEEHIKSSMYCDLSTVYKKVDAIENLFEIAKINAQEAENALILSYIKTNYHISDDASKRIKVSVLLEEVQKELKLTNANLKHKFANILGEIGLQKKRFSDGMYLYGIESKAVRHIINHKVQQQDIDAFMSAREKELSNPIQSKC